MKQEIDLEIAELTAKAFIEGTKDRFRKAEIVGSIRRRKPKVHDVDIVAIPIAPLKEKILKFQSGDIPIEVYVATEENYEVLKLIRTGSVEHNRKLCSLALKKGWKLKADGQGLITKHGVVRTEHGILEALLGAYIEPEGRD